MARIGRRIVLTSGLTLAGAAAVWPGTTAGQSLSPLSLADQSTLSVLRGAGEHALQGRAPLLPAHDGQDVATGDRLITAGSADFILTFFEGSTFSLLPGTDIIVQRLLGLPAQRDISIRLTIGTIWAKVTRAIAPGTTFEVHTPAATAVVRGTQFGARVLVDGTFQCWTREGAMTVATAAGQDVDLAPGETVVVQPDGTPAPRRVFNPAISMFRVRTEGPVWPLLVHPHGGANGIVEPGIVACQTFGAFVLPPRREALSQTFDVPANVSGEYALLLVGRQGSVPRDCVVDLMAAQVRLYPGGDDASELIVDRRTFGLQLAPGERLLFSLAAAVAMPEGAASAQDALIETMALGEPRPIDGQGLGPAKVLVSPVEVELEGLA